MLLTLPFRNEYLYPPTEHLVLLVSEYPLSLSVDHDDTAFWVDEDHGIGGRLQHTLIPGLTLVSCDQALGVRAMKQVTKARMYVMRVIVLLPVIEVWSSRFSGEAWASVPRSKTYRASHRRT